LQYDFACEAPASYDPNVPKTVPRSLSAAVEFSTDNRIIHRVTNTDNNGYGDFEVYDGVAKVYRVVFSNLIPFDSDVSTTPVVSHVTFTGHADGSNPVYDVTLTTGSGTYTATDFAYYHYANDGARLVTAGAAGCSFNTFNSTGDFLVDNVSLTVPEPGILVLLTCGMMCLVAMRRRD